MRDSAASNWGHPINTDSTIAAETAAQGRLRAALEGRLTLDGDRGDRVLRDIDRAANLDMAELFDVRGFLLATQGRGFRHSGKLHEHLFGQLGQRRRDPDERP
jgi:hypothetical protein